METKYASGSETFDESDELMHYISRPGITQEEVKQLYNRWAGQYTQDLEKITWNAPRYGAEEAAKYLGDRKDALILDAAAGTGLMGIQLKLKGFEKIDALDASEEMIIQAKKTGAYTDLYCDYMGPNKLKISDDTYDAVVTVGSFVPGHVKEDCYEELIRITKPGGFFILVMCERYFRENPSYAGNIEPRMLALQEAGLWTLVTRHVMPNYHQKYDGVIFVLRIEEGKNAKLNSMS